MVLPLMIALAAAAAPAAPATAPGPAPQLAWPVACEPGRDCFVQNYVDHDPGPAWKDYRCRSMTYDGHTGTDIRIPGLGAMRAGVAVRAAAPGRVRAVRDGVADKPYVDADAASLTGRNCGNAVVVDLQGGWSTIYCHLRQGSVKVKQGETIAAGQPLGLVGESGEAAFPHLHFEIRRAGRLVDPFAWSVDPSACSGGRMLWSPAVAGALAYRSPMVLNRGFASGPVKMETIEDQSAPAAGPAAPALVAYVRAIGLEAADVQSLLLTAPDGRRLAFNQAPPLDRAKAQYMLFTGARRPAAGWAHGTYLARYEVRRQGRVVLTQDWTITL